MRQSLHMVAWLQSIQSVYPLFKSVLIANRGEIAVRIIRACQAMGIRSIAVYSDVDVDALHVRMADEAHRLGASPARDSYLNIERVVAVARDAGAEAIHPGYGLLSENAEFASAVVDAGLTFIGPSASVIATMGDKVAARNVAIRSGVPTLPGSDGVVESADEAVRIAESIGFPVLVKACFGGGGRGMRVVDNVEGINAAFEQASRESGASFGRSEVFLEHYVMRARHVELQVLADCHGNLVYVGDRDCSVQRRHQKLMEEAPAPGLPSNLRGEMASAAVSLAKSVDYYSAGTVEFLVDPVNEKFYFLEMNTRLQVEHGVTELVSGIDLVEAQIRVAAGEILGFAQDDIRISGHAIQARLAAEDPWEGFQPNPGRITALRLPVGPWIRLDFGVEAGDNVPGFYDSMFGKIQVWGRDRESARRRLSFALKSLHIGGISTTSPYQLQLLEEPSYIAVEHDTGSVERDWQPSEQRRPDEQYPEDVALTHFCEDRMVEDRIRLGTLDGEVEIAVYRREDIKRRMSVNSKASSDGTKLKSTEPVAPMDASVVAVEVEVGDEVEKGAVLVVLEAMKMEVPVVASRAATVEEVLIRTGQMANKGSLLVRLSDG